MGSPEHISLRPANVADSDELFPLARELATTFVPTHLVFVGSLSRLSADSNAMLTVAEEHMSHHLVGYLLGFRHDTFIADGPIGWVEELYVRPEARRAGIARALMEGFESWAWARGVSMVTLATRRAQAFYEAIGYESNAVFLQKLAPGRSTNK